MALIPPFPPVAVQQADGSPYEPHPEAQLGVAIERKHWTPPLPTSREKLLELAQVKGCALQEADEWTLQVDLDDLASREQFERQLGCLRRDGIVEDEPVVLLPSSGGNRHAVVRLKQPRSVAERIALQLILGSDPHRERMALRNQLLHGYTNIVLFRPVLPPIDEDMLPF